MKKLMFILLFVPTVVQAQVKFSAFESDINISLSPTGAYAAFGMPQIAKVGLEYKDIELIIAHSWKNHNYTTRDSHHIPFTINGSYIGLFVTPINITYNNFLLEGGIGWFFRKYPNYKGRNLNFTFELAYKINKYFSIQYSHISSGFNIFAKVNPGIDNVSLVISF